MKSLFCFFAMVLVFGVTHVNAQTQLDMNQNAHAAYKKADLELNKVYKAVRARNKDDKDFLHALKNAQKAWIVFRDAEVEVRFPLAEGENPRFKYGSAYTMCVGNLLEELTLTRVKTLRKWLDGEEEGDMCGGSIPVAEE